MNVYRNLLLAAAANLARFRTRSIVVVLCLAAITGPYVTGVAISEGIRGDAELAVREGADLYLTLDHFGRNAPVPLEHLPAFRESPHITKVVPRIVGRARVAFSQPQTEQVETQLVVILGLESEQIGQAPPLADGSAPRREGGEVLLGSALAGHLGLYAGEKVILKVGDLTMPFRVSGIFRNDASIWSAQLVCMTLQDAGKLFAQPDYASDFLIYTRPGPINIQEVRRDALAILGDIPYRLQSKTREVSAYVDKGFRRQQGVFTVLFLVAFAVGIPAVLVASGLGLTDQHREIGIRKAVGWQTTDIMFMVACEQALLSVMAAALALLVSYVWVRIFNGVLIAQFFISELGIVAPFPVPAQFTPAPPALALMLCVAITMTGSLHTTWRLATHPPAEAFR